MQQLLKWCEEHVDPVCKFIQALVEVESPTNVAEAVNAAGNVVIDAATDIASVRRLEAAGYGRHLLLEFKAPTSANEGGVLALGHLDTVWPIGTLERMPFRSEQGRLWGPGVLDMKGGIAMFVFAIRAIRELRLPIRKGVSLLLVSDEEVGSPSSRPITESEARRSDAVLVLEPGTGLAGKLKTARKGIAHYSIRIAGRAAHAGVDFEQGASAVVEAARVVAFCAGLTDLQRGITVNPGVVRGGTRSNVVAAEAEVDVDVRAPRAADLLELDRTLKALRPVDERCQIQIEGGINRPPMERTAAIADLFRQAQKAAETLGFSVQESSTGGGSDGNFTAAIGVSTLDGLGAVGEGAHAIHESILINKIAERTALLVELIRHL